MGGRCLPENGPGVSWNLLRLQARMVRLTRTARVGPSRFTAASPLQHGRAALGSRRSKEEASCPIFVRYKWGEVTLRVALQGGGPLVVMVHGFPESWYSWRHQMGPIAAAGFTACATDVRGYGGSDKPPEVEAYRLGHLFGAVAELLAALLPDKPPAVRGHHSW